MTMGNRPCGRNAIFKCVAIIATVVTTFSCVACGNAADSGSTADKSAAQSQGKHEKVKKSATQGLDGAHLRDNDSLYKVYDDSGVETMYLTVSRGNKSEGTDHSWSEINQYSVDDYAAMRTNRYQVNGLLQVGDEQGPVSGELGYGEKAPNATVQVRGQSSSLNKQKNYKIELKSGKGKWRGQRTIALNKHMGEGLRFRNKMAYDLIRGIDQMMGLRTQFVHLYVKDETSGSNSFDDYGLYTQVEQLNKSALQAHGLDKNGQLYKVNYFEFQRDADVIRLADDPKYNLSKFEEKLEVKGNSDHTKLIAMLNQLNDYSVPMSSILGKYFDTENLAYWMAFQLLTGNTDTQSRNMYLYSPTNSDLLCAGLGQRRHAHAQGEPDPQYLHRFQLGAGSQQLLGQRAVQTLPADQIVPRRTRQGREAGIPLYERKTHQYDGGPLRVHHQAVFVEDARFHVRAADARPV